MIDDHVSPYKILYRRSLASIDTTEDFANQGEAEWPTKSTFGRESGCSERTIDRAANTWF
jgi:hypothetical protein